MTELEGQIRYWENLLLNHDYIISPSTQALIRGTIRSLKELQKLKKVSK